MGKLNEIRNRPQAGDTPRQLIEQGYAKSSVHRENKKLYNPQPDTTAKPVNVELQELRQKRDNIKIEKEIAELEANKEKLPERVAALESRLTALESWCDGDLVDIIGVYIFAAWRAAGRSKEDAVEASQIKKAELKRKA